MGISKLFGPVISVYTRAQAIEDGVLVDLTGHPDTRLYKHPVAFTKALWAKLQAGAGQDPEVLNGRVWDVCYMSGAATARVKGPDSWFPVIVGDDVLYLRANVGLGDEGEPVVTIGFRGDF